MNASLAQQVLDAASAATALRRAAYLDSIANLCTDLRARRPRLDRVVLCAAAARPALTGAELAQAHDELDAKGWKRRLADICRAGWIEQLPTPERMGERPGAPPNRYRITDLGRAMLATLEAIGNEPDTAHTTEQEH